MHYLQTRTRSLSVLILVGILFFFASVLQIAAQDPTPTPEASPTPSPASSAGIQSTSVFTLTLGDLGNNVATLYSPYGSVEYSLRLPQNWEIADDVLLRLDLSYKYASLDENSPIPATFGDVSIDLDGRPVDIVQLTEQLAPAWQVDVRLPAEAFADTGRAVHALRVSLGAGYLCAVPHAATLQVHPSSVMTLPYQLRPIQPDLAAYPQPFSQRSFLPDAVTFVLPESAFDTYLSDAAAVAAQLGSLTFNRTAITVTTDADFLRWPADAQKTHVFVFGTPADNQLVQRLNRQSDLPVEFAPAQVELAMHGPSAVQAGQSITYRYDVTNPSARSVTVDVVGYLPEQARPAGCSPDCDTSAGPMTVTWPGQSLAANQTASFSVDVQVSDALTGTMLENGLAVMNRSAETLNTGVLAAEVVADASSAEAQSTTFAAQQPIFSSAGQFVAPTDGLLQELVSPWDDSYAVMLVTGGTSPAVHKAAMALASRPRFPGFSGQVAVIKANRPPNPDDTRPFERETTSLAQLGYSDQWLYGQASHRLNYYFDIPAGWLLDEDATVNLDFAHSQIIDYESSQASLFLNQRPIASTLLSDETADAGHLTAHLNNAPLSPSGYNRLGLQVDLRLPNKCLLPDADQVWFAVRDTSTLILSHQEQTGDETFFSLNQFPYPFQADPRLEDTLLVLPADPTSDETQLAIRMAALLGSLSRGQATFPHVVTAASVADVQAEGHHLVVIGRPSRNAVLQAINDQLPQPFAPGTDVIEQTLDEVIFRLPPDADLGYVQLLAAPWDNHKAILAITGTTDDALAEAVDTVVNRYWNLKGNLTFVTADAVNSLDTRPLTKSGAEQALSEAIEVEMTPVAVEQAASAPPTAAPGSSVVRPTLVPGSASPAAERPAWLMPLIGMTVVIVIASLLIAFWQASRKRL